MSTALSVIIHKVLDCGLWRNQLQNKNSISGFFCYKTAGSKLELYKYIQFLKKQITRYWK